MMPSRIGQTRTAQFPLVFWISFPRLIICLFCLVVMCGCFGKKKQRVYTGMVEGEEVQVSSELPGKLVEVLYSEGQSIEKGAKLAEIDHKELDAQLKSLKAQYKSAQEEVDAARARSASAQQNLDRNKVLWEKGNLSDQKYQDLQSEFDFTNAKLKAAEAQLEQCLSNVERSEVQIAKSSIYSPISGVVTSRIAKEGEFVNIGSPVYRILDTQDIKVKVYVPEKVMTKTSLMQDVKVRSSVAHEKVFAGRITYIAPKAEFIPKNIQTEEQRAYQVYAVKCKILEGYGVLKPGMYADVILTLE